MKEVTGYVGVLELGEIGSYKNIAVAPLMAAGSDLEYLTLEEAIGNGLEVEETGNVPEIDFGNKTGKEVLIIEGESILGGGQNRMVENNIFMQRDFKGKVPVKCVQSGRWDPQSAPSGYRSSNRRTAPAVMKAAKIDQGAVWDNVGKLSASLHSISSSADYHEIVQNKQKDIDEFLKNFEYVDGSVGIVIAVQKNGKRIYGTDIFDQSGTMRKHHKKIVESYVLEAMVEGGDLSLGEEAFSEFLDSIDKCSFSERRAISLGVDSKIDGGEVDGSSLVYEGRPLYVNMSTKNILEDRQREGSVATRRPDVRTGYLGAARRR
jgi:hypothetical protein